MEVQFENPAPLTIKTLFGRDEVKSKFKEMLGQRAASFMTSVLQICSQNKQLSECDPMSIYQCAAVAATLDLPLNNNLGFAYIVPYNGVAQFQMGYKGFIQLAQRSGAFKSIYATPIYDGQIVSENPLDGYEFDFTKKKSDTVVGYASKFRLLNGFEAVFYMDINKMRQHALKYSQTFKSNKDYVRAKSLWTTDFDSMAQKTVIKLILSKFAPLSVDMQKAIVVDQSVIKDADTLEIAYVDNQPEDPITVESLTDLYDEVQENLTSQEKNDAVRILNNQEEKSYKKLNEFLKTKKVKNDS